jgi:hypothetical protein
MNPETASHAGSDLAIALALRLRRECRADVVDVDPLPHGSTIHLAIPTSGLVAMDRLRRDLWMSFVSRNVETRKDATAKVRVRVASQREALGRSRAITERNRVLLIERASA